MTLPAAAARTPVAVGLVAAGVGGALGAVARWALSTAFPAADDAFPWVTFTINVTGAALLAGLPALPATHRVPWLPVFLGTGLLGGFTTMSAASVETFTLLDHGSVGLAIGYSLGSLAAALLAVVVVDRLSTPAERADFELREGDE